MRKKFRFLTILAVCVMVLSCFSVTAFAYADDTEPVSYTHLDVYKRQLQP